MVLTAWYQQIASILVSFPIITEARPIAQLFLASMMEVQVLRSLGCSRGSPVRVCVIALIQAMQRLYLLFNTGLM